jgi:hypothetical protein
MKNGFIFLCEPRLARFDVNYCDNCTIEQLEVTFTINSQVIKGSSKELNQAGY